MGLPGQRPAQRPGAIARLCISLCVLLVLAAGCHRAGEVPYYHTPDFTPLWSSETDIDIDTLHTIAAFQLTNQNGDRVTNDDFRNKVYVADFFFTTCPGICPKLTANLKTVANAFENNSQVAFISHSVLPQFDSVSVLKAYAEEHEIKTPAWHLVTGSLDSIYTLARQSYFVEQEMGFQFSAKEFLHTEHFVLVDRQGHIRGLYKGTLDLETQRLIDDIRTLLHE